MGKSNFISPLGGGRLIKCKVYNFWNNFWRIFIMTRTTFGGYPIWLSLFSASICLLHHIWKGGGLYAWNINLCINFFTQQHFGWGGGSFSAQQPNACGMQAIWRLYGIFYDTWVTSRSFVTSRVRPETIEWSGIHPLACKTRKNP